MNDNRGADCVGKYGFENVTAMNNRNNNNEKINCTLANVGILANPFYGISSRLINRYGM
jgi:hypothetical protein